MPTRSCFFRGHRAGVGKEGRAGETAGPLYSCYRLISKETINTVSEHPTQPLSLAAPGPPGEMKGSWHAAGPGPDPSCYNGVWTSGHPSPRFRISLLSNPQGRSPP